MIESGGATVIGISITACLTNFLDFVRRLPNSEEDRTRFSAFHEFALTDSDIEMTKMSSKILATRTAFMIDGCCNKLRWQTMSESKAVFIPQWLIRICFHLRSLKYGYATRHVVELLTYNIALVCGRLPEYFRDVVLDYLLERFQRYMSPLLDEFGGRF
jgi:hypothetical protein